MSDIDTKIANFIYEYANNCGVMDDEDSELVIDSLDLADLIELLREKENK